jgi:hypothetical protein
MVIRGQKRAGRYVLECEACGGTQALSEGAAALAEFNAFLMRHLHPGDAQGPMPASPDAAAGSEVA